MRSSIDFAANILAVQIERAEDRTPVAAVTADEIEHRKGVVVADDGRAIDHTGPHRQRRNGLDGEREAVRQGRDRSALSGGHRSLGDAPGCESRRALLD